MFNSGISRILDEAMEAGKSLVREVAPDTRYKDVTVLHVEGGMDIARAASKTTMESLERVGMGGNDAIHAIAKSAVLQALEPSVNDIRKAVYEECARSRPKENILPTIIIAGGFGFVLGVGVVALVRAASK